MNPVHRRRPVQQFRKRQVEQRQQFFAPPVVAEFGRFNVSGHCGLAGIKSVSLEIPSHPVNRKDAMKVDDWLAALGRALLPPRCLICREQGCNSLDLCGNCFDSLPWNRLACDRCALPLPASGRCGACLQRPPPLDATCAVFLYGSPVDRLLPRLKFHRDLAAGRLLAELMIPTLEAQPRPLALVPVPLHRQRLRQRGYDQALELARPLARRLDLPVLPCALRRIRNTAPQSELDARQRRRNLRAAFQAGSAPLPDHVALVDDVMTTGQTLHAAALALRRAGVARVDAWVCARVP